MIPLTFDLIKICQLGILKCVLALEGVWKQHHPVPYPSTCHASQRAGGWQKGTRSSWSPDSVKLSDAGSKVGLHSVV